MRERRLGVPIELAAFVSRESLATMRYAIGCGQRDVLRQDLFVQWFEPDAMANQSFDRGEVIMVSKRWCWSNGQTIPKIARIPELQRAKLETQPWLFLTFLFDSRVRVSNDHAESPIFGFVCVGNVTMPLYCRSQRTKLTQFFSTGEESTKALELQAKLPSSLLHRLTKYLDIPS